MPTDTDLANLPVNRPDGYETLSELEKQTLQEWIELAIQPAKHKHSFSSYGLKHEYEYQTGLYVTNGQFKGAMLQCGYTPIDTNAINWKYRIKPQDIGFKLRSIKRKEKEPVTLFAITHITQEQRDYFNSLVQDVISEYLEPGNLIISDKAMESMTPETMKKAIDIHMKIRND